MSHHPTHRTRLGAALATLVAIAAGLAVAVITGGHTPAEEAFLAEEQRYSSLIEIDEAATLTDGWRICGALGNLKPQQRRSSAAAMPRTIGVSLRMVLSATEHLCPEVGEDVRFS